MIIKLLVDAGDMKPGPAVGQKLGPLGINMGKVVQDVNAATKQFKGVKVPVELIIEKDKSFTVNVLSPPTTELLKKELGIEKASGLHKKIKAGNVSIFNSWAIWELSIFSISLNLIRPLALIFSKLGKSKLQDLHRLEHKTIINNPLLGT